jgi:hypothetical protein
VPFDKGGHLLPVLCCGGPELPSMHLGAKVIGVGHEGCATSNGATGAISRSDIWCKAGGVTLNCALLSGPSMLGSSDFSGDEQKNNTVFVFGQPGVSGLESTV